MIKSVIFDLDGTLLNRDGSLIGFIAGQYERLNPFLKVVPKQEYISRFVELDNGGYTWKDKVYRQLIQEYQIQGLSEEELLQDYLSSFKNHCIPFPNLNGMLENLLADNIRLGMITNGRAKFQMDNLEALGVKKYFQEILISESEGVRKPEQEIFSRALAKLDITSAEAVYVGDHPVNDMKAARKAGMKCFWKKNPRWSNAEADFVIDDLGEIPSLIRELGHLTQGQALPLRR